MIALTNRFAFEQADRQRHTTLLEWFEKFGQVFHAAGEPVEFVNDNDIYLPIIHRARSRSMPGRFRFFADSPASTIKSMISPPCTIAITRIFALPGFDRRRTYGDYLI
ncbi:MAG TPA: hypothetical protein VL285_02450 [Bryobacteraceae bacterium]|nr:hypothetical protein [Bryobacteraceae bacterium]